MAQGSIRYGTPPLFRIILPSCLVLVVLTGCDHPISRDGFVGYERGEKSTLIAQIDREHDFGPVIASSGRKIEHQYRLRNATGHDVKVLSVINRKTCCGVVRPGASILHPGDATEIGITLLVGDRFGRVVHETEVVTDLPEESSFILQTAAVAVPPIRIEQDPPFDLTIGIGTTEPRPAAFRVYASGTAVEPPVDLASVELRSTAKVGWGGPKEPGPADAGLLVETRRFIVTLDPTGPPGERRAEVLLQQGSLVRGRQIVSWDVAPSILVSPKVVAMRSGQREYLVVLQSSDRRAFRIKQIECGTAGVAGRAVDSTAAWKQTVQFQGLPQPERRRGTFTILTDHPLQTKVALPYVVIE